MADSIKDISKVLSLRRIVIPIILGIAAAGFLLVRSLNETRYVEVNQGSYAWQDSNGNGLVDYDDPQEFKESPNGSFDEMSFAEMLSTQKWGTHTLIGLGLALLMIVVRDGGYMYRIRVLTDNKLSWRQSFRTIMLWEFASALTPSVVGGSGIAIFILNREGINLGKSTATVFITALMDELFYVLTVPLVLLIVGADQLFPESWAGSTFIFSSLKPLFLFGYFFIVVLTLFISLSIFFFPHKFKRIVQRIFTMRLLKRWLRRATKMGDEVIIASRELKDKRFSFWAKAFGSTYASWTARFLTLNFLLMAFTQDFDHVIAYGKQLVMWVIMLISPTPRSSGVAELALDSFFNDLFESGMTLFLIAVLWRLLTYFLYLFIGAAIFPSWLKTTASLVSR